MSVLSLLCFCEGMYGHGSNTPRVLNFVYFVLFGHLHTVLYDQYMLVRRLVGHWNHPVPDEKEIHPYPCQELHSSCHCHRG